jgi:hypothetical protein
MRLSFQTVCILFGVTLAHLFLISALSPVEGENAATRPGIVLDPELESLFEADTGGLAAEADELTAEEEAVETPAHPLTTGEMSAAPAATAEELVATAEELVATAEEPVALPSPRLAGNDAPASAAPAPSPIEPPAREPAPAIREIRTIAPVPRS